MNLMGMFLPFMGAFVVLLVLSRLIVSAADEHRKALETENGRLEFNPNPRGYWEVYLFIACLGYVVLASFLNGIKSGIAPAFFCAGFISLLLLAFPGSVVVDKNGLGQVYWLRGEKRIAWSDVAKVSVDEKKREITILGKVRHQDRPHAPTSRSRTPAPGTQITLQRKASRRTETTAGELSVACQTCR